MLDEMIIPDRIVPMGNGKISTLTDEDIKSFNDNDDCTCDDCLFNRIETILDVVLDDMVNERVFAILDDIFGEDS